MSSWLLLLLNCCLLSKVAGSKFATSLKNWLRQECAPDGVANSALACYLTRDVWYAPMPQITKFIGP